MRFVSRFPSLTVVYSDADRIFCKDGVTRTVTPTKYAEFKNGVFDTQDEDIVRGMIKNPSFDKDFYCAEISRCDLYDPERLDKIIKESLKRGTPLPKSKVNLAKIEQEAKNKVRKLEIEEGSRSTESMNENEKAELPVSVEDLMKKMGDAGKV